MVKILASVSGSPASQWAGLSWLVEGAPPLGFKLARANPARPVRVAVGEPGRRSSVWRIWANRDKNDVYIASRRSAGLFKVSLHESGDWRIQWVHADKRGDATYRSLTSAPTEGRIMDRWQRPEANAAGWTDALWIRVPSSDITEIPGDDEKPQKTQWITDPGEGRLVDLRIALVQPNRGVLNVTSALEDQYSTVSFVNGFRLASGETAVVFAVSNPISVEQQKDLKKIRQAEIKRALDDGFDIRPETGPKAALVDVDTRDHHRSIWDLSLAPGERLR